MPQVRLVDIKGMRSGYVIELVTTREIDGAKTQKLPVALWIKTRKVNSNDSWKDMSAVVKKVDMAEVVPFETESEAKALLPKISQLAKMVKSR